MDKSVQLIGREKPWEFRPLSRTLVLSSYQMTEQNLPIYIKKIRQLHPAVFHRISLRDDDACDVYETKLNGTERVESNFLLSGKPSMIGNENSSNNFSTAGFIANTDTGNNASWQAPARRANTYHIFPDYGYVELIDRNGQPVTKEGDIGEIVATGFHTGIFPFIRYKTGDIAVYTTHQCECGRQVPLFKSVEGRVQDFMISKTNRLVPLMGVLQLISKSSPHMKEYQFYQDREGEMILHIVKKEGFSESDVRHIKENIQTRLGDEFSLSIEYLDSIPRTSRGKYQFFVQKLPVKYHPVKKKKKEMLFYISFNGFRCIVYQWILGLKFVRSMVAQSFTIVFPTGTIRIIDKIRCTCIGNSSRFYMAHIASNSPAKATGRYGNQTRGSRLQGYVRSHASSHQHTHTLVVSHC